MSAQVTEASVLRKLRERPGRGGVRLSYEEADWLVDLIENPVMTQLAKRVLIDQAKRKRMHEPGVMAGDVDGSRHARPAPPVVDVELHEPVREPPAASGWRGNPLCGGEAAAA